MKGKIRIVIDRPEIPLDEVIPSLVKKYMRTDEFVKQNRIKSISSIHPLIYNLESYGLRQVIKQFIGDLKHHDDIYVLYKDRKKEDWLNEWRDMQGLLFRLVLRNRGTFRQKGQDVYFGYYGDEEVFNIPKGGMPTLLELHEFSSNIGVLLSQVDPENIDSVCSFLANIHFEFIRIHPFLDGNGRIGRVLTDQLAISLGYPLAFSGYPGIEPEQGERYRKAIRKCVGDPTRRALMSWIKSQIDKKISEIA